MGLFVYGLDVFFRLGVNFGGFGVLEVMFFSSFRFYFCCGLVDF